MSFNGLLGRLNLLSPFTLRVTSPTSSHHSKLRIITYSFVFFLSAFFTSCATPVSPTGGPADKKGPVVLFTTPETGTVNFKGQSIQLYFDEFVNRTTVSNNVTIEPDLGLDFELKWKRKRLSILFKNTLPDSTTIIVTLGGNITDIKGNKMGSPVTIAFSTGDEIDEGSIVGRLRSADTGEPLVAEKVALYRAPIALEAPFTYQAETDTGGVFRFSYLREGTYRALYFEDRNRNKIWDSNNEFAQTFSEEHLTLAKADTVLLETVYVERQDTTAPRLQGVGLFSQTRMRFRFSEEIQFTDSTRIVVTDTLGSEFARVLPLYINPGEEYILFGKSEAALAENRMYGVKMRGITDKAGNEAIADEIWFQGSAQEDTTRQRIIEIETPDALFPDQSFSVVYADVITDRMLVDSVVVAEGDLIFNNWPTIEVYGNRLFIHPQEKTWIEGVDYQFLVWNPITRRRVLATPEIWDLSDMGELELSIPQADSTALYRFTLENEQQGIRIDSTMNASIVIDELPPLQYKLMIYEDVNANGIWDRGEVQPFSKPEPLYIRQQIKVQTGFTSEVIIDF